MCMHRCEWIRNLPVCHSTSTFKSFKSLPYALHGSPAIPNSAVILPPSLTTFLAAYPGHASRFGALTATSLAAARPSTTEALESNNFIVTIRSDP